MAGRVKPDADIDIKFLESCEPAVTFKTFAAMKRDGLRIPAPVLELHTALNQTTEGFIPASIKALYERESDTPQEFHEPSAGCDNANGAAWNLPTDRLTELKKSVDYIMKSAKRNFKKNADEGQWYSSTVVPLMQQILGWPDHDDLDKLMTLNTEFCPIEPVELEMICPGDRSVDEGSSDSGSVESSFSEDPDEPNYSVVDQCMGLVLDDEDEDTIKKAYKYMNDNERSLNQSLSYFDDFPLTYSLIYNTRTNPDQRVPLGMWKAAQYAKFKRHGWDTSMPMPGIVVNKFEWEYYLGFVRDNGVIMIGPQRLGSTETIEGAYEIASKMEILMQWAETKYAKWFDEKIMPWMRERIRQGEAGGVPSK